jgi:hypothetical protein
VPVALPIEEALLHGLERTSAIDLIDRPVERLEIRPLARSKLQSSTAADASRANEYMMRMLARPTAMDPALSGRQTTPAKRPLWRLLR